MIFLKRRRAWVGSAMIAALAGCLSPHENLYTLDVARAPQAVENRLATIVVGPVALPQLVDRPQLVVQEGGYQVSVLEQERWAAPLKESLPRLLADELSRRVSNRRFVSIYSRAVTVSAGQLAIDINRFDVTRHVGARVSAHWVYRAADTPELKSTPIEGDTDIQTKITQPGYPGLVQALQQAVLGLAGDIAQRAHF